MSEEVQSEENKMEYSNDKKGVLDKIVSKVTSRKLLVWSTATYALLTSGIESSDWVAISLAYIGSEALVDIASKWRSAG
jgi:hypothetical protein